MEDVVFQNQLYHDVVSDDGDIHLGDMVAWQHDETVCGEVVELLSTKEEVVDPDFSNI